MEFSYSIFIRVFRLNTEIYFVNLRVQSECGNVRTRKTSNTNPFYAVTVMKLGSFIAPPCKEKYRSYHGSIIQKERQLFSFWDFYLFEVIFLISQRFPNGLKPKCVSDFISFNFVNIMQLIFIFFSTRYFGEIEMYVAWFVKNQIHLFTFCRQLPVFPNNSCKICLI